jgi:hypothetical protein
MQTRESNERSSEWSTTHITNHYSNSRSRLLVLFAQAYWPLMKLLKLSLSIIIRTRRVDYASLHIELEKSTTPLLHTDKWSFDETSKNNLFIIIIIIIINHSRRINVLTSSCKELAHHHHHLSSLIILEQSFEITREAQTIESLCTPIDNVIHIWSNI